MQFNMSHSRRQLPPVPPHKRKERDEAFEFLKPSRTIRRPPPPPPPQLAKPRPVRPRPIAPIMPPQASVSPPVESPPTNNILLAGYMAYEFLQKGTLFGQLYDPAVSSVGSKTMKQPEKVVEPEPENKLVKNQRYAGVSELVKNGVRIPGIVNPSQLARFLNL